MTEKTSTYVTFRNLPAGLGWEGGSSPAETERRRSQPSFAKHPDWRADVAVADLILVRKSKGRKPADGLSLDG